MENNKKMSRRTKVLIAAGAAVSLVTPFAIIGAIAAADNTGLSEGPTPTPTQSASQSVEVPSETGIGELPDLLEDGSIRYDGADLSAAVKAALPDAQYAHSPDIQGLMATGGSDTCLTDALRKDTPVPVDSVMGFAVEDEASSVVVTAAAFGSVGEASDFIAGHRGAVEACSSEVISLPEELDAVVTRKVETVDNDARMSNEILVTTSTALEIGGVPLIDDGGSNASALIVGRHDSVVVYSHRQIGNDTKAPEAPVSLAADTLTALHGGPEAPTTSSWN
ncbi:hypothetical protein [Citricoccus nitrophenolicus]|uniref:hypothetical protein n=1 Tax=Citricoccus nitrophenolicus TaxID=863575 RepID=UPI0031ECE5E7